MMYYSGEDNICPICGGKIKHPYTGLVTSEQIKEDILTCIWMEVCDEGRGTIGYTPICKNGRYIYSFDNFIPRGDKVILEFLNKIKWLKTSNTLYSYDNIYII